MANQPKAQVRNVREGRADGDGQRILVDRVWPRGVSKDKADLDEWRKELAPSTELRKWYGHDPDRFDEFARRYRAELDDPERAGALRELRDLAGRHTVTLLTGTKRTDISQAAVLAEVLRQ